MSESPLQGQHLTVDEEVKIVALLARGDSLAEVQEYMEANYRKVSATSISKVRKRNKENLQMIKARLLEKAETDELANKQKANKVISKRLDREDVASDVINKAQQDYLAGKIPIEEFVEISKRHKEVSLTELVGVSKEMHNQTKEEDSAPAPQKDLSALVEAIRSGDEVTLSKMTFNKPSA